MQYLLILIIILMSGCRERLSPITHSGLEGQSLPSFDLFILNSTSTVNTNDIPTGKPILLLYIDPDCPFCRKQTKEITNNVSKLKNIKLYIISPTSIEALKIYSREFNLDNHKNIIVAKDLRSRVGKYLNITAVPYYAFYSKTKALRYTAMGNFSAEHIRKMCSE